MSHGAVQTASRADATPPARRPEAGPTGPPDEHAVLVGSSEQLRTLLAQIRTAAWSDAPVLITGEGGTGKAAVAHAIHDSGARRTGPFVQVHAREFSSRDLDLVLFGVEHLSTDAAMPGRPGCFEAGTGGTVFLSHVTAVPDGLQSSVLSVLEHGQVRRRGSMDDRPVDVRVVASAGEDVDLALIDGTLREDLFFGVRVLHIEVPPLRQRRGDIVPMARLLLEQLPSGSPRAAGIDADAAAALEAYGWPGNVRQLRSALRRGATAAGGGVLREEHLPPEVLEERDRPRSAPVFLPVGTTIAEAERRLILATLEATDFNKTAAAQLLGMDVKTLRNRLKSYH